MLNTSRLKTYKKTISESREMLSYKPLMNVLKYSVIRKIRQPSMLNTSTAQYVFTAQNVKHLQTKPYKKCPGVISESREMLSYKPLMNIL